MAYRSRTTISQAAVLAVAIAAAGMGRPAFAADDGYQNVFSSVLSAVGVMPADEVPAIDYRERAPLVLPPKTTTLVKPVEPGANRSAAWPADPDVARRRKASEDAKAPLSASGKERAMSKEDQLKFRAQQDASMYERQAGCPTGERSMARCRVTPEQERAADRDYQASNADNKKAEAVTAGVEPAREYLTQPPSGYLKATKTVQATHEAPVVKEDASSVHYGQHQFKDIDPLNN